MMMCDVTCGARQSDDPSGNASGPGVLHARAGGPLRVRAVPQVRRAGGFTYLYSTIRGPVVSSKFKQANN